MQSDTFGIGILGTGIMGRKMADKACFCEKPLTHDIADAEALREAVLQSRLPFAVNFPFARGTASCRMREIVRNGDLGPNHGLATVDEATSVVRCIESMLRP